MLPADVLKRTDLTASAKLAFSALAMESWGSPDIAISHQALASICGTRRSTMLEALKQLTAAGLIAPLGEPVKQVQPYRILHARIAELPTPAQAESPAGSSILRCGKCAKAVKQLGKTGWCRSCVADVDAERLYRSALEALGQQASVEQVAEHLHLEKISRRWRRIARRMGRAA